MTTVKIISLILSCIGLAGSITALCIGIKINRDLDKDIEMLDKLTKSKLKELDDYERQREHDT